MKSNNKPSIFLMPEDLIGQIERASELLGISKSAVVRNSLRRDLEFVLHHEVAASVQHREQIQSGHSDWIEDLKQ